MPTPTLLALEGMTRKELMQAIEDLQMQLLESRALNHLRRTTLSKMTIRNTYLLDQVEALYRRYEPDSYTDINVQFPPIDVSFNESAPTAYMYTYKDGHRDLLFRRLEPTEDRIEHKLFV